MSSTTTQRYPSSPLSNSNIANTTTTSSKAPSTFQQRLAPQKKRIMSITQTYYLAHKARAKLSTEAARADHDLRLLVGHANLLDSLMLELADAEREQESWFNQSVRGATRHEEERAEKRDRHIQWADAIVEDPEEDWHADDADSYSDSDSSDSDFDSEDDDEDVDMADVVSLRRLPSAAPPKPLLSVEEDYDDDMEEDDLEEDYAQLELVRTPSHSTNSPPELIQHDLHDSDSSDDESMPPSPPNTILTFTEKEAKEQRQDQKQLYSEGAFFLPRKNASTTSIISAISVY